jgi:hypothetical protein
MLVLLSRDARSKSDFFVASANLSLLLSRTRKITRRIAKLDVIRPFRPASSPRPYRSAGPRCPLMLSPPLDDQSMGRAGYIVETRIPWYPFCCWRVSRGMRVDPGDSVDRTTGEGSTMNIHSDTAHPPLFARFSIFAKLTINKLSLD